MKKVTKFFMAALLAGMCSFGYAQDVKVNINNNEATIKEDCAYRINGICSSEDIGGVDVEMSNSWKDAIGNERGLVLKLTNYNSFPVTVVWAVF